LPVEDDSSCFSDDNGTTQVDSNSEYSSYETDLTDESDIEESDKSTSLLRDNEHPPEYYLRQLDEFDEEEYAKQDYSSGSTYLLNLVEEQWEQ
jgi:hypothetical protein